MATAKFARLFNREFECSGARYPAGWYTWTGGQFNATKERIKDEHEDVTDVDTLTRAGYFVLPETDAIRAFREMARAEREARRGIRSKD